MQATSITLTHTFTMHHARLLRHAYKHKITNTHLRIFSPIAAYVLIFTDTLARKFTNTFIHIRTDTVTHKLFDTIAQKHANIPTNIYPHSSMQYCKYAHNTIYYELLRYSESLCTVYPFFTMRCYSGLMHSNC